jgi:tetratricopeptide (TPR) repeat protein
MIQQLIRHKYTNWLFFIAAFLMYSNTLNNQYALDDFAVILDNSNVNRGFEGIGKIFTTNMLHGVQGFNDGLYRPITTVTFAIEQELFGEKPSISHFINVMLFAGICLLLFKNLKALLPEKLYSVAFIGTAIFVVHPIHTEVVANIKSRDELFASLFLLASLWNFLRAIVSQKKAAFFLAFLWYTLALFSKESSITYFAIIPLLLWLNKSVHLKQLIVPTGIMLLLSIGFYGLHSYIINSMDRPMDAGLFEVLNNPIAGVSDPAIRYGTAFYLQVLYLGKLLFPVELLHDYSYNLIPNISLGTAKGISGLLIFIGLVGSAVYGIIKRNLLGIMAAFYLLGIAVVSQLFIPIGALFAERFLFVPSIAFCVTIAFILNHFLGKKQIVLNISLAAILFLFGIKTEDRNGDWKNNQTLYAADIEAGAASARINYNYGSTLTQLGNSVRDKVKIQSYYRESAIYLQKAIEIYPEYWDAYNNLGLVYKYNNQLDLAEKVFDLLLKKNPNYTKGYYNQATVQLAAEKGKEALENFKIYSETNPTSQVFSSMGTIAGTLNDFEAAKRYFLKVIELEPNNVSAYNYLGTAEGFLGRPNEAINYFRKAVELDPRNVDAYFNMAISYSQTGNVEKEKAALSAVLKLAPGNQQAISRLRELGN